MKITFLGGVEEVTGSKYLIEDNGTKLLVDCGLFQGDKEIAERNWEKLSLDPSSIDAIVLTHAHIDHTGYIPVFVKQGFKGPIYCSQATYELCKIMLVDSGYLQEERAKRANERNLSNSSIEKPLYTQDDAQYALQYFHPIDYDTPKSIGSLHVKLIQSHHILGASFVMVSDGTMTLTFSGDLGRPDQLIMKAPPPITDTDYLVLESTYGNRLHSKEDPLEAIGKVVSETLKKDGVLIIPTFAVGRAQTILYILYALQQKNIIPHEIPIFLDSPMAIKVTKLFCEFPAEHKLSTTLCTKAFNIAHATRTVEESKKINNIKGPAIILAGSGMADGGRALYHFQHYISDYKNTILFVGYQAEGTLGDALVDGKSTVHLFGKPYEVHASIKKIDTLSAHADYNEMLEWLSNFEEAPKKVFLTHGQLESAQTLKVKIEERFGWPVVIPTYEESFDLK
jgi:metallo-beta-lactamase family protein